jgi:hypothetical protein
VAWDAASRKYVREYGELLAQAAAGSSLNGTERDLLRDILRGSPEVVHLQSGHGLDDVALVRAGAKSVVGVDYRPFSPRGSVRTNSASRAGTSSPPFRRLRWPVPAPIWSTPGRAR